ncbi:MAG TPA: hypothetical protein DCW31_06345 [Lactobacillus sp.]|nr:hypothetical protein [Lactobacillus sp.]
MSRGNKYQGNITSRSKRIIDAPLGGTYVGANLQRHSKVFKRGQFRKGRQTVEIVLILAVLISMVVAFLFGYIDVEMTLLLVAFVLAGIMALDQHFSGQKK